MIKFNQQIYRIEVNFMKQITALEGENKKVVGTKKYFQDLNNRGFMIYLPRNGECLYYDNIVAL